MTERSPGRSTRRALARQAGKCPSPPYKRNDAGAWVKVASRCRSRRCVSCGVLWAGDTRVKLLRNIEAYGGAVMMITLTAPGENFGLRWDREACTHDEGENCSGTKGCVVLEEAAHIWNQLAPQQWRCLHRRAQGRASRRAKRLGRDGWAMVGKVWEFQKRGVLHLHVVLPAGTPAERMASLIYVAALDELREDYCFGFVDRGPVARKASGAWADVMRPDRTGGPVRMPTVREAGQAAGYVAKYIAGCKKDGTLAMSETVTHRDVPGHVVTISRRLTDKTGCTMQSLRDRRYAHMIRGGLERDIGPTFTRLLFEQNLGSANPSDRVLIEMMRGNLPPPD